MRRLECAIHLSSIEVGGDGWVLTELQLVRIGVSGKRGANPLSLTGRTMRNSGLLRHASFT